MSVIVIKNLQKDQAKVQQGESCDLVARFRNGNTPVTKAQLATVKGTLYRLDSEGNATVVNSRYQKDLLTLDNANGGTVENVTIGGKVYAQLTWRLQGLDHPWAGSGSPGDTVEQYVLIEWTWDDGTLTDDREGKTEGVYLVGKRAVVTTTSTTTTTAP